MIKVYGAAWCGDTVRTLEYLDDLNLDYEYIDVESDENASQWVKAQNGGSERKPTLIVGTSVVAVPTEAELEALLEREGLIDKTSSDGDIVRGEDEHHEQN